MYHIDLELERKRLDREITFFHVKRARRIIKRALLQARREKDIFFIQYFTAQHFIIHERYSSALIFLKKALSVRPKDGCTYNDIALCFAERGKHQKALAVFNEGIRKDRNCTSLYHNKGWFLNLLGGHKSACVCFHKALELEGDRPESFYSLADSCFHLGDYNAARKYFQKAAHFIKGKSAYLYRKAMQRLGELP